MSLGTRVRSVLTSTFTALRKRLSWRKPASPEPDSPPPLAPVVEALQVQLQEALDREASLRDRLAQAERLVQAPQDLLRLVARAGEDRPLPPATFLRRFKGPDSASRARGAAAQDMLNEHNPLLDLHTAYSSPGVAFEHFYAIAESLRFAYLDDLAHRWHDAHGKDRTRELRAKYLVLTQLLAVPRQILDEAPNVARSLMEAQSEAVPAPFEGPSAEEWLDSAPWEP